MDPESVINLLEFFVGGLAVMGFLISRVIKIVRSEDWTEGKDPAKERRKLEKKAYTPPRKGSADARPAFRSEAADHEHITVGGLTREARLEQLETLLDAGLLDREEYRERKRRIEEEMG